MHSRLLSSLFLVGGLLVGGVLAVACQSSTEPPAAPDNAILPDPAQGAEASGTAPRSAPEGSAPAPAPSATGAPEAPQGSGTSAPQGSGSF